MQGLRIRPACAACASLVDITKCYATTHARHPLVTLLGFLSQELVVLWLATLFEIMSQMLGGGVGVAISGGWYGLVLGVVCWWLCGFVGGSLLVVVVADALCVVACWLSVCQVLSLACVRVRVCVRVPAGVCVRRCACAIVEPIGTASSVYWGIFALVWLL